MSDTSSKVAAAETASAIALARHRSDIMGRFDRLSFVLAGVVKYVGTFLPPLCGAGCLNAIADPQAIQVMLSALFAFALHASQQKEQV